MNDAVALISNHLNLSAQQSAKLTTTMGGKIGGKANAGTCRSCQLDAMQAQIDELTRRLGLKTQATPVKVEPLTMPPVLLAKRALNTASKEDDDMQMPAVLLAKAAS